MTWMVDDPPKRAVKHTTIFFYDQRDLDRAKGLASAEIKAKRNAFTRDATAFLSEIEPCHAVVILPSVRKHHREAIKHCYGQYAQVIDYDDNPSPAPKPQPRKDRSAAEEYVDEFPRGFRVLTNKDLKAEARRLGVEVENYTTRDELMRALLPAWKADRGKK